MKTWEIPQAAGMPTTVHARMSLRVFASRRLSCSGAESRLGLDVLSMVFSTAISA
jgi:hypothetical protein